MKMMDPGSIVILTGKPGRGKTNTAHVMMEIALKKNPDLEVISNVYLDKSINPDWEFFDRYHVFNSHSEFLWWLTRCKRPSVLWDEAGNYSATGAGDGDDNHKNRGELERFLKLCRKWHMNVIWIDQTWEGSVPPKIRMLSSYNIDFPSLGLKDLYEVDGKGERRLVKRYPNRVLTKIPYDTDAESAFTRDLPNGMTLDHVYRICAGKPPKEKRKILEKWLLSHGVAPPKRPGFPTVPQKRENTVESGEDVPPLSVLRKFRFRGISPSEKIPGRIKVWSILQEKPRMTTKEISAITNLDRTSVQKYRKEFIGKLKVQVE